jgi:replicative superfamily II helicase
LIDYCAVAGTIQSRQDAVDYMTWTYFFRRLLQNPTYYGLEAVGPTDLNSYLTGLVGRCLDELELSYCVERGDEEVDGGRGLYPTVLGRIASYYYLAHQTVQQFRDSLQPEMTTAQVLQASFDDNYYFFLQGCGSGLDPDSATFVDRIRIGNPDPGSGSRGKKIK